MVLRRTNTALNVVGGVNAPIDMTIDDFSEFYSDYPIKLTDNGNKVEYLQQVPFDRRLDYKDSSNTFCYDENENKLYFNGNLPFSGTLYIDYVSTTDGIDLESNERVWNKFPKRFLPILGFYAIGLHMGGVDYDSITARQAPNNLEVMKALKMAMETWDNSRQMSTIRHNDPTNRHDGFRNGAIDRSDY